MTDPRLDELLGNQADELREDVELLDGAANPFDLAHYLKGNQTPVFFGSAINNFGVKELLDAFVEMSPPPAVPHSPLTREVSPYEQAFSGFVFKIQANMDMAHRDRIAFLRVCSGTFKRENESGITTASARKLLLPMPPYSWPKPVRMFRKPIPVTLSASTTTAPSKSEILLLKRSHLNLPESPTSHRNTSGASRLKNPMKIKQLQKGLHQLAEEGATQVFRPLGTSDYILGAVGVLQFDVTANRLKQEYGADTVYEPMELSRGTLGELRRSKTI